MDDDKEATAEIENHVCFVFFFKMIIITVLYCTLYFIVTDYNILMHGLQDREAYLAMFSDGGNFENTDMDLVRSTIACVMTRIIYRDVFV